MILHIALAENTEKVSSLQTNEMTDSCSSSAAAVTVKLNPLALTLQAEMFGLITVSRHLD